VGCGDRLSTLLKEPLAQAGRQLRPEADELLKIGIDWTVFCANCTGFCASFLVNCACPEVFGKGSSPSPTALGVGVPWPGAAPLRITGVSLSLSVFFYESLSVPAND